MSLLPYFPLAYGLLTGKYSQTGGAPEGTRLATETARLDSARWDVVEGFRELSEESGRRNARDRHRRPARPACRGHCHRRRHAS